MSIDFVLSQTDPRPMYLQIMAKIQERISDGDWPVGHRLPSIRQLAVGLRVSAITVKRAYLELERQGVILTHHGKGSFVATGSPSTAPSEVHQALQQAVVQARSAGLSKSELHALLDQIYDSAAKESP